MESQQSLSEILGLSEPIKNPTLLKNLQIFKENVGIESFKNFGNMFIMASKMKPQSFSLHHSLLASYIVTRKIDSEIRLKAAMDYLLHHLTPEINAEDFERNLGLGIVITSEDIETAVEKEIKAIQSTLEKERYRYNSGLIMNKVRQNLLWADAKAVKEEVDLQLVVLLGPKTEEDYKNHSKRKDKQNEDSKSIHSKPESSSAPLTIQELMKTRVSFHKPGENYKTDGWISNPSSLMRLEEHVRRTGGQVRTRFPPEPNGILHIGHAKAININFGYASAYDGICFLRYDDTNPEKEEAKFFESIKEMVEWLGYKPHQITHSSDYFFQLYKWAQVLIEKDLAYVCHQKVEDIRGFNPPPSPWRTRPTSESSSLFEDMKNGVFEEGEATLRLKLTLEEGKIDPVAYRIKYTHHHRTGSEWCIYPTYDYTHCLCDSLEDITHSLCTKEFQNRRSSYYWLCNAVDTYCPVQWEYGRLNIGYSVISKRKIAKLISSGICSDWDDPRLFTLTALRRRGFPPEAINSFVARLGITGAQMTIDPSNLESVVRSYLNTHAPRAMVVLEPQKIFIINFSSLKLPIYVQVPRFPDDVSKGVYNISFDATIFIEKSDFNSEADKSYRRLSPHQPVGLRYAGLLLTYVKTVEDIIHVEASILDSSNKPKAFIHWASFSDSLTLEVRLYERLFKHSNPEEVPEGFLSDINTNSCSILTNVKAPSVLKSSKLFEAFQFERNGFFSCDPDSNPQKNHFVFNRTVSLKEDSGK